MTTTDQLVPILKKLRLSGLLETLDIRRRQAVDDHLSFDEFLLRLLMDEVERRDGKQLHLRLRRAQFDGETTLESFDFAHSPQLPKTRIIDLATCAFIHRHEAALLIGPTGTGKTHIAQAIGHRACRHGLTTLFTSAAQLFTDLRAARADNSLPRRLLRYTTPDLLIIDDLGLRPLRHEEPEDLYDIIRQRYRRGSIIITSNRAVAEWYPLFGDPLLASAAMDRLLHDAYVIEMQGDSYRTARRAKEPG